ncbi:hypothetical protein OCU04_000517 [Sclerotinia nivalis]|uniref:Alcohol dehydrogenase n=1 Tax=Sclerotinia nivalis TaxID=352851 RepID=A0A9X0AWA7_9HELO|nr:hypothetical protein OCU04_000517 [Sclerotinia nivalis]
MNKVPLKQAKIIGYRFGETDGLNPEATLQVWNGLNEMLKTGLVKPIVFGHKYNGLESVVKALEDLSARKVWGKEVVMVEGVEEGAKL